MIQRWGCAALLCLYGLAGAIEAQVPGRNVNMVSGSAFPTGDPYLQRQNEPSLAVSTRNPQHLVAGANDYRAVDIPGITGGEQNGDAWVGLFRSFDGGLTWTSTLMPGFPQDANCHTSTGQPVASPMCVMAGFEAAADPVVRAGTNGMFYYSAIAFDRPKAGTVLPQRGGVFLHRFIDNNNAESFQGGAGANAQQKDSLQYLGGVMVDQGSSSFFYDKPWIATDVPRGTGTCTVAGQQIPAGNVYIAYTGFDNPLRQGGNDEETGRIYFRRSTDCGASFPTPAIPLSVQGGTAQGAVVAVDPASGNVYVAWRQFFPDAVMLAKSTDFGQSFSAPVKIANISPFDQSTSDRSFRTNSYPTMAVDGTGRIYAAWAQVGIGPYQDARIVLSTSVGGTTWSAPAPVDNHPAGGHQIMPAMSFAAGKLTLVYYDFRDDETKGIFAKLADGTYVETTRESLASIPPSPNAVFTKPVADPAPQGGGAPCTVPGCKPPRSRHTVDVRVAQADAGASPQFHSVKLSQYLFGSRPGSTKIEQLQVNPPNLPMFSRGTKAFMGDYIDVAAQPFLFDNGTWSFNTAPDSAAVFYGVWTDNRDVRPPSDGNWANYTPTNSAAIVPTGNFINGMPPPPCQIGEGGSRNQNIYTAAITQSTVVRIPVNAKTLNATVTKTFIVNLTNASNAPQVLRLTIPSQPTGGSATFFPPGGSTTTQLVRLDVTVPPHSTISRAVFARSTDPRATVKIQVQQLTAVSGSPLPGGVNTTVRFNPDPSNPANPDISNPDISNSEVMNPDISNPDISNPDISNPDISNPDISNPDISNVNVANPDISNPDISNPDISNPDISNPDISNPDISNPDISNGAISDVTWQVTNNGNTTASFSVKLLLSSPLPQGFKTQLVAYKVYGNPLDDHCSLALQLQNKILLNLRNPALETNPSQIANPSIGDSGPSPTVELQPSEVARVTLRIVNPDRTQNQNFDPRNVITLVVVSQPVNTTNTKPGIDASGTEVLPATLPSGRTGQNYSFQLQYVGSQLTVTFSQAGGSLPPGITLSPSGLLSGIPIAPGTYTFSVIATDGVHTALPQSFTLRITGFAVLGILTPAILPPATVLVPYSQTLVASGGTAPYTWAIPAGDTLPPGLQLKGQAISGIPTATGTYTFRVRVTDSAAAAGSAEKQLTLNVLNPSLSFVTLPPTGIVASPQPGFTVQVKLADASGGGIANVPVKLQLLVPSTINANAVQGSSTMTANATTDATGIATFSSLHIGVPGAGYQFEASSARSGTATTPPFTVGAPANWPSRVGNVQPAAIAPGTKFALTVISTPATNGTLEVVQGNHVVALQAVPMARTGGIFHFSLPSTYNSTGLAMLNAPLTAGPANLRVTYNVNGLVTYSNWFPVTLLDTIISGEPVITDIRTDTGHGPGSATTTAIRNRGIWIGAAGFNNENGSRVVAPHNRVTFTSGAFTATVTPSELLQGFGDNLSSGYYYFKVMVPESIPPGTVQITFQTRLAITTDAAANLSAPSAPVSLTIQ